MRIVTGTLKGRAIPFSRRHGDVKVTSSRLKESFFDMLGADLSATTFLDLCSGTGQMALEANSRGAHVVAAEPDRQRFELLKKLLTDWKVDGLDLFNAKAQIVIERLHDQRRQGFDGIFIDPPYGATVATEPLVVVLLQGVVDAELCSDSGVVAVQHSMRLELPESVGQLQRAAKQRRFGDSLLSLYEHRSA